MERPARGDWGTRAGRAAAVDDADRPHANPTGGGGFVISIQPTSGKVLGRGLNYREMI